MAASSDIPERRFTGRVLQLDRAGNESEIGRKEQSEIHAAWR